jgi:hypothetical protein
MIVAVPHEWKRWWHAIVPFAVALGVAAVGAAFDDAGDGGRTVCECTVDGAPPESLVASHAPRPIAGHVYGRWADGTYVTLRLADPYAEQWKGRDAYVQPDGSFDFGVLPAAAYQLVASRRGEIVSRVVRVRTDGLVRNEWQDGEDVEVYADTCAHHTIRVVDAASGAPIAGATLRLGGVRRWTTDREGTTDSCVVGDGSGAVLIVGAPDRASQALFVPARAREVAVALWPAVHVRGRVVDRDGRPVTNVLVTAVTEVPQGHGHELRDQPDIAISADDGTFDLVASAVVPDRLRVRFGGRFAFARMAQPAVGELDARFVTGRAYRDRDPRYTAVVRGRIVCRGVPIPDAALVHVELGTDVPAVTETRSRADGTFALVLEHVDGALIVEARPLARERTVDLTVARGQTLDAVRIDVCD